MCIVSTKGGWRVNVCQQGRSKKQKENNRDPRRRDQNWAKFRQRSLWMGLIMYCNVVWSKYGWYYKMKLKDTITKGGIVKKSHYTFAFYAKRRKKNIKMSHVQKCKVFFRFLYKRIAVKCQCCPTQRRNKNDDMLIMGVKGEVAE